VRLHGCVADGFGVSIVLAAGCGLQAQETAGLVVEDIDWLGRALHVHRQWHGRLDRFEDLKASGSTRTVPVGDDILTALAAHLGEHGEGEHGVLLHTGGRPMDQSLFQSRWRATRKRAGLELRFHSLRLHYASTAISAGVPFPALSRALGHSKLSITLDVYQRRSTRSVLLVLQGEAGRTLHGLWSKGVLVLRCRPRRTSSAGAGCG
jgi:integrase